METITVYFESSRDTEEGIKQDFIEAVDDAFMDDVKEIVSVEVGYENVPDSVKFETEADVQAMMIEVEYFLSAKYGAVGATDVPKEE